VAPVGVETTIAEIEGLTALWKQTLGDPEICIAVLDGPVEETHPCFRGARLTRLPTLVAGDAAGAMLSHGTHVTSEIFGQPAGPVHGVAPHCRGLIVPVFREGHRLTQLDLARAIEQAVKEGAHVINISGGERSPEGQADDLLARAIRLCDDNGVLITAAAGNDGCECLHVPAAVESVLAVGAMSKNGLPLGFSNWGDLYLQKGVLAPGENIRGAVPGGSTAALSGTSFAVPIVAGVAGLLLSIQRRNGRKPDPRAVGDAIIASALPCALQVASDHRRCLAGVLNIPGAYALVTRAGGMKPMNLVDASSPDLDHINIRNDCPASAPDNPGTQKPGTTALQPGISVPQLVPQTAQLVTHVPQLATPNPREATPASAGIVASCDAGLASPRSYVFAIGTIGYDFGTEARRDSFRQLMPAAGDMPANPFVAEQMVSYLEASPPESTKLIWTFNLELTPIYAVEAELPFAREVYEFLRKALKGQILKEDSPDHITRVSLPGVLSNRTVRLFSGQIVPVVVAQHRGLWSWNVHTLLNAATAHFDAKKHDRVRTSLRNFLDKVYYELRNLGQSSPDRALNYSATNVFQAKDAMIRALYPKESVPDAGLYTLDDISVSKSPFCRMDSDCWDVKLTFFDPENDRRARTVMRFTVDVSDELPVTFGPVRYWTESGAVIRANTLVVK